MGGAGPPPELQVTTKSMSLQSFAMTELLQVGHRKNKTATRVWYGQAFNLDERYKKSAWWAFEETVTVVKRSPAQ